MKKLLALATCVAAFSLLSANVLAAGAFTETRHIDHLVLPLIGPPPGGSASGCPSEPGLGVIFISPEGNGVEHLTVNGNGDWGTSTYEGAATLYDLAGADFSTRPPTPILGGVIAQGHLQTWFGVEDNNQNGVFHTTLNFNGTTSTGGLFGLHGNFDVTMNANGDITATVVNVFCRT